MKGWGRAGWLLVAVLGIPVFFFIGVLALFAGVSGDDAPGLTVVGVVVVGFMVLALVVAAITPAKPTSWWAQRFHNDRRAARAAEWWQAPAPSSGRAVLRTDPLTSATMSRAGGKVVLDFSDVRLVEWWTRSLGPRKQVTRSMLKPVLREVERGRGRELRIRDLRPEDQVHLERWIRRYKKLEMWSDRESQSVIIRRTTS